MVDIEKTRKEQLIRSHSHAHSIILVHSKINKKIDDNDSAIFSSVERNPRAYIENMLDEYSDKKISTDKIRKIREKLNFIRLSSMDDVLSIVDGCGIKHGHESKSNIENGEKFLEEIIDDLNNLFNEE